MANMKPGDRVKLNRRAKRRMQWQRMEFGNGTIRGWAMRKHVQEFRRCVGVVIGPTEGSEDSLVDVRWEPSGLRYAYRPDELQLALPWEKSKWLRH